MGKKRLHKKAKGRDPKRFAATNSHSLSPKELIDKAIEAADQFEAAQALRLYQTALATLEKDGQPSEENLNLTLVALESSAFILLEQSRIEEAQHNLRRAVELSPNQGHEKYMYLAQLAESREAVDLYRCGIDVLKATLESRRGDSDSDKSLRRAMSNAFCSISDLYMTDLCDEEDAEACCREAVACATAADETNPQAWLSAANFQTVKAENGTAKASLEKCLSLYWPEVERTIADLQTQVDHHLDGDGDNNEEDEEEPVNRLDLEEISGIPYEAHIQMARMMMELEMYERAADVLEALLEEDDECAEIFYLLTVIGQKIWKDSDPFRLRHYVETAKQMCTKEGDKELADEMDALLSTLPPPVEDEEEEDVEDDSDEIASSGEEQDDAEMDIN